MPSLIIPALPPTLPPQPTLTAGDLVIRPWLAKDAPAVYEAYQDPAIQRWHARVMDSVEEAEAWALSWAPLWEAGTRGGWAIADAGTDAVLGRLGLGSMSLEEGYAGIGYWVMPAARGRRVATRAVNELTRWLLHDLGMNRLDLHHSVGNEASCRVAQACGYQYEGTLRSAHLHADGWHSMHLHARLRSDA
ncbi:GNAT family N-acetyltransferase [Longispora albida]|uniref:GNAT family N-acetyltransferase n=1 Tax=Longispora albida TaxID=203523 RepID=UPI0003783686|nr:GNAT family N-acetyltransferase [Longispora albida]